VKRRVAIKENWSLFTPGRRHDKEVQAYLIKLHDVGSVMNGLIARGIMGMTNFKLLSSNGGAYKEME